MYIFFIFSFNYILLEVTLNSSKFLVEISVSKKSEKIINKINYTLIENNKITKIY